MDKTNRQIMPQQTFGPRMAKPKKCEECIYRFDPHGLACKGCPHGKTNTK